LGLETKLLFSWAGTTSNQTSIFIDTSDTIGLFANQSTSSLFQGASKLRDTSAWYHVVVAVDTTLSSGRVKIYINNKLETTTGTDGLGQNAEYWINSTNIHYINRSNFGQYVDGYLSETHLIDGQALDATSFGEFDINGVWVPKAYGGTYGTNGFYLDHSSLGVDSSGNGHDWTANNLVASDIVLDSPTNNFATLNPNDSNPSANLILSEGNLRIDNYSNAANQIRGTIGSDAIPFYYEYYCLTATTTGTPVQALVLASSEGNIGNNTNSPVIVTLYIINSSGASFIEYRLNGVSQQKTFLSGLVTLSVGDILQHFYDPVTGNVWIGVNNVWYDNAGGSTGNPSAGLNPTFTIDNSYLMTTQPANTGSSYSGIFNFGQDSTFAGNTTAGGFTDANGIGDFKYQPPTGALALCIKNLPTPTIENPSEHFNTVLYDGNNNTGSQAIIGVGFQPDLIWQRTRSVVSQQYVVDSVRGSNSGVMRTLFSTQLSAEQSLINDATLTYGIISSLDSDGFTVDTGAVNSGATNYAGRTYLTWNWKAGGAAVTNNDGTITSQVSANTQAGFSIVGWVGVAGTVGHGLNQAPELIIQKQRGTTGNWPVQTTVIDGSSDVLYLDLTNAKVDSGTLPTNSVFTPASTSSDVIAYAFHSVEGYSKMGSYTGNGSADGTFVFTNHRPAWILIKRTDSTSNWTIIDNKREGYNVDNNPVYPNLINTEGTTDLADMLSNGFKLRTTDASVNASGGKYIYMSLAEQPFNNANAR
jgi:hypothetical protein